MSRSCASAATKDKYDCTHFRVEKGFLFIYYIFFSQQGVFKAVLGLLVSVFLVADCQRCLAWEGAPGVPASSSPRPVPLCQLSADCDNSISLKKGLVWVVFWDAVLRLRLCWGPRSHLSAFWGRSWGQAGFWQHQIPAPGTSPAAGSARPQGLEVHTGHIVLCKEPWLSVCSGMTFWDRYSQVAISLFIFF